jgi:hypothetical protein
MCPGIKVIPARPGNADSAHETVAPPLL